MRFLILLAVILPLAAGANSTSFECVIKVSGIIRDHIETETPKDKILRLQNHLNSVILGSEELTNAVVVTLLVGGHILIEGPHGTAKTLLSNTIAKATSADVKRIQFTPDLTPSDVTGASVFNHETRKFDFHQGPVFTNFLQAEELNRAPERTQSAFFEAMAERQVTTGGETRQLPDVFMIIATQNPKQQLGTYNLPEAQLDRFLLSIKTGYLSEELERKIMDMKLGEKLEQGQFAPLSLDDIREARQEVKKITVPSAIRSYITSIIQITREPYAYQEIRNDFAAGVSNRGTMSIVESAQAIAWLKGKGEIDKTDVDAVLHQALRHRILLSDNAKSDGKNPDDIIEKIQKIANRKK